MCLIHCHQLLVNSNKLLTRFGEYFTRKYQPLEVKRMVLRVDIRILINSPSTEFHESAMLTAAEISPPNTPALHKEPITVGPPSPLST
jgi:hypothetical protein